MVDIGRAAAGTEIAVVPVADRIDMRAAPAAGPFGPATVPGDVVGRLGDVTAAEQAF